jgi:hypothetical protein
MSAENYTNKLFVGWTWGPSRVLGTRIVFVVDSMEQMPYSRVVREGWIYWYLHWQSFMTKATRAAIAALLSLATMGDATQIGFVLFVSRHRSIQNMYGHFHLHLHFLQQNLYICKVSW